MKKRFLASLLALIMVLSTIPTALAIENFTQADEPQQAKPVCICETLCTEETFNTDCPICGSDAGYEACGYIDRDAQGDDDAFFMEMPEDSIPEDEGAEALPESEGAHRRPMKTPAKASNVWEVSTPEEFNNAVAEIENKRDNEGLMAATIALRADIALTVLKEHDSWSWSNEKDYFAGIEDVTVTLTSVDKAADEEGFQLRNFGLTGGISYPNNSGFDVSSGGDVRFLVGPVIFDQITLCGNNTWLFAQGNSVVFTEKFCNLSKAGVMGDDKGKLSVVGGMLGTQIRQRDNTSPWKIFPSSGSGSTRLDSKFGYVKAHAEAVNGTNIEVRGGYFKYIIGGCYNGSMMGDTHVTVALDPDDLIGYSNIHNAGNVFGGSIFTKKTPSAGTGNGAIYGDTYVNALSGTFSNIYGGSMANFAENTADNMGQIWGDTHVTVGQASGMDARFSDVFGGGIRSTIGQKVKFWDGSKNVTNYCGGNTHVEINATAKGISTGSSDIHGGGDMDVIWGTTELILNGGGQDVVWVFAGGSNSAYQKQARIYNMIPDALGNLPKTAAKIVVNGGTWNEIYSCHEMYTGSTKMQWICGDVVVDFNGGKVGSFCLSGPRTAIGTTSSDSFNNDKLGGDSPTSVTADSILNVHGGKFSSVPAIRGYRFDEYDGNTDAYGRVTGKRIVNFKNTAPVSLWGIQCIDEINVDNTAVASVSWYSSAHPALERCKDLNINAGTFALAGENTLKGKLKIQTGGTLMLPTQNAATPNAVLNCDTAEGVAGGLATINVIEDTGSLSPKTDLTRPTVGEVYVRAKNLGADTETSVTPPADSKMLDLSNPELDLYVEYTTNPVAVGTYTHTWRIAKDASVTPVTVMFFSHKDTSDAWILHDTKNAVVGAVVSPMPTNPTRPEYQFDKWTLTEDGTGTEFTGATVIDVVMSASGVVSVYGQWNPIVTFDANGGGWSDCSTTKTEVADGAGKVTPPTPNPANGTNIFDGWYTDAAGGTKIDFSTATFTSPTPLYAHWIVPTPMVTVTYSSTGAPTGVTVPTADTIAKGSFYTAKSCTAIPSGWRLEGWYKEAGLSTKFTSGTVDADMTLYGKWIQTFTITYTDGVAGEEIFTDQVYTADKDTTTPAFSGTPTRSGYTFKGWLPEVSATVTETVTYVAQWEKRITGGGSLGTKYKLHYESNGGTTYPDEYYTYGAVVTLDKVPTRAGYIFTGWYADKELTQKVTSVTMTSDKTVYAGWEATGVPGMLNGDDHYAYVVGYSGGEVRPNANISRAETATIFFRLLKAAVRDGNLTAENAFTDVSSGEWYNKAVSTMAKLGIIKGRSAETFAPNAPITRAEFAAICARFDAHQGGGHGSFSDISGHWAEAEIERAVTLGWINGYPDGTFRPDAYITRAEAMTMINRVLCRIPESESDLLPGMTVWVDCKPTDWFYLAVQEATNSHDFNRQGEVGESWTKLASVPDWKRYQ